MEKKQNELSCLICISQPEDPVVTQCGHIFCWKCIKEWYYKTNKDFCPICKNGLNIDKVIPLYANNSNNTNKHTDKPKVERNQPQSKDNETFISKIIRSLTFSSSSQTVDRRQQTQEEKKINNLALILMAVGALMFIIISYI